MRLISTLRDVAPFVPPAVLLADVAVSLTDVTDESLEDPTLPAVTLPAVTPLPLMTESGESVECPMPLLLKLFLLKVPPNTLLSVLPVLLSWLPLLLSVLPMPLDVDVAAKLALRAVMSCASSLSCHVTGVNTDSAFERLITAALSVMRESQARPRPHTLAI